MHSRMTEILLELQVRLPTCVCIHMSVFLVGIPSFSKRTFTCTCLPQFSRIRKRFLSMSLWKLDLWWLTCIIKPQYLLNPSFFYTQSNAQSFISLNFFATMKTTWFVCVTFMTRVGWTHHIWRVCVWLFSGFLSSHSQMKSSSGLVEFL